jgi:RNA recognition motif-containing protein
LDFLNNKIIYKMNIYVGNLSWNMTNQDLQELFTPFGEVISAKIVTDKFKNDRSKGFGFVEMGDAEGNAAIAALNETEVDGRKIVVNESQPRPEGERRQGGFKPRSGGGYGGGRSNGGGYNRDRNSGGGGYNRDRNSGGGGYSRY